MFVYHAANTRGQGNFGWLEARYSFSFANYRNPERMGFGSLLVLNDDIVAPATGFPTHPHNNMEIVTIPLKGKLAHKDSVGNSSVITAGEIQRMSAGTGIYHSEYNASETDRLNLLQIWVLTRDLNIQPSYEQKLFDPQDYKKGFKTVVSPDGRDGSVTIHQDAWFSITDLEQDQMTNYELKKESHGVYFFIIEGEGSIEDKAFFSRDGLGFTQKNKFTIKVTKKAKILAIEVPMS